MSKSLLEQLPEIVRAGKRQAERILEGLESRTRCPCWNWQRRIKARKASACGLCKPWKQGWADKKTVRDIRHAQRAQQQLAEISQ
jgi:hypothetical protein